MTMNVPFLCNFINGVMTPPSSGEYIEKVNPATSQVIAQIPRSNKDDVDKAVQAAKDAFPDWSKKSIAERATILRAIADGIETRQEELALMESQDCGKPLSMAKNVDIPRAVANFRFFAGAIEHDATHCHEGPGMINYTQRHPIGVAVLVTPWNLPLYLLSWKLAPAMAAGNTAVCKPSEMTPRTAHALAEIAAEAGVPKGVINVIQGYGVEAGQPLISHEDVDVVSFTGGTATGEKVAICAAKSFKKTSLELGGKNATIVFEDCDFEKTVSETVRASFLNSGQICLCGSRVFIQRSIYDRFSKAFAAKAKEITVGDPATSWMGSVISMDHLKKVEGYIRLAKEEGGTILCGGGRPSLPEPFSKGAFLEPTVVGDLSASSRCATEEVFGPFVTLHAFDTEEEVLAAHDSVRYGLAGSVWTQNLARGHRVAGRMQTGMVWVNCWLKRDFRVPFGGVKDSGVGLEGGYNSLDTFSEKKNICISYE